MKKRITSKEIAKFANVSQSAVSRAFSPDSPISPKTREHILKTASRYGFTPNAMAGSLITQRSGIIGLVMAYMENMFYPYVLEQFSESFRKSGYHVLLFIGDESGSADSLFQEVMRYRVDGLILASTTFSSKLTTQCMELGVPLTLFNRTAENTESAGVVMSDNFEGGRAVGHFLARGEHKRIAYLAGIETSSTNMAREAGFMQGLRENKTQLFSRYVANYNFETAEKLAESIFSQKKNSRPDAVFVANDHMSFALMNVIRKKGLEIPGDVSIVGYDNVPMAAWETFQLTTVEQKYKLMVEITVKTILEQIKNKTILPQNFKINGDLIIRNSAKIPPGAFKENDKTIWRIPS